MALSTVIEYARTYAHNIEKILVYLLNNNIDFKLYIQNMCSFVMQKKRQFVMVQMSFVMILIL